MEWLKKMMDAVEYIEDHMEEPLDAGKIAQVACSSTFHFQLKRQPREIDSSPWLHPRSFLSANVTKH